MLFRIQCCKSTNKPEDCEKRALLDLALNIFQATLEFSKKSISFRADLKY